MQQQPVHIIPSEAESRRWANRSLRIIWITGVACVLVILFFFLNPRAGSANYQPVTVNRPTDARSIDQLLLTSDEALLSDKKSFVNGALRFEWQNQEPDLNEGNNRTVLYANILKKKLQRIPKAQVADFSVRPVPQ